MLPLLACLCFIAGCRDNVGGKASEPPNITGLWKIDSASLRLLTDKLGFDSHTNRYDHLLLLNEDGSCAYRGADSYYWKPQRTSSLSDIVDNYERNIYWYDFSANGKQASLRSNVEQSWYLLDREREVIDGPYGTNAFPRLEQGPSVCVNRWTQWRLVTRSEFSGNGSLSDENYNVRCRWHVKVFNNFHRTDFFHVGFDEQGVYLWKPAIYHYDFAGPEKIIFRRYNGHDTR
jgi:hypothetical protein